MTNKMLDKLYKSGNKEKPLSEDEYVVSIIIILTTIVFEFAGAIYYFVTGRYIDSIIPGDVAYSELSFVTLKIIDIICVISGIFTVCIVVKISFAMLNRLFRKDSNTEEENDDTEEDNDGTEEENDVTEEENDGTEEENVFTLLNLFIFVFFILLIMGLGNGVENIAKNLFALSA